MPVLKKLYYPEKIIESKFENNRIMYLIKWLKHDDLTWEPKEHINHRTDLIEEYKNMQTLANLSMKQSAYIYCRVSSKKQSEYNQGHTSLEVQEKECTKYCNEHDYKVIEVVKEVYSAKDMSNLKGLLYLLNIVNPGSTIFVYDLSRFSRNVHHALNILEELQKNNINIFSVTENLNYNNPLTRNQFRIQLCESNHFSELCSHKVKESIKFRKDRGDYIGGTKFGYKTEKNEKTNIRKLVENPEEINLIKEIFKLSEKHTIKKLYQILLKKNIKLRNHQFSLKSLKRFLNRLDLIKYKQPSFISISQKKKPKRNKTYFK
jgi:site-specific DNA recombinase